ncbi:MAG: lipoyl(octanoyl) transferase LipB [Verrucomicrobiae bacterium]|nr:lipoyl(octanoyl) transferase LipB [Verrucomicrobiae bacterium]NNJ42016.1 lipoyl(octanoyl) transferase LipB [Akkermansiaceae bacterium]
MHLQFEWLGQDVDYQHGLEIQQQRVQKILDGSRGNQMLALEHQPVYTIGRTRDQTSLGNNTALLPHPLVEINRGGQGTYHGPGQLTGYPIVDLHPLGKDLHAYIRALEEALILTCAEYGVTAGRQDGLTGVWVENRKLASIGVGVRKWVAMHGFAINLTKESLNGFLSITPCGIDGVTMTSLESECGSDVDVKEFAKRSSVHLGTVLSGMQKAEG